MLKTKYWPHIDGLRAVAVMAVVAFHADVRFFSGGYVGVDVFFVISGFLIGSMLLREIEQGNFSAADFYKRRVLRIAPALFAMMLFLIVVIPLTLFPRGSQILLRPRRPFFCRRPTSILLTRTATSLSPSANRYCIHGRWQWRSSFISFCLCSCFFCGKPDGQHAISCSSFVSLFPWA